MGMRFVSGGDCVKKCSSLSEASTFGGGESATRSEEQSHTTWLRAQRLDSNLRRSQNCALAVVALVPAHPTARPGAARARADLRRWLDLREPDDAVRVNGPIEDGVIVVHQ